MVANNNKCAQMLTNGLTNGWKYNKILTYDNKCLQMKMLTNTLINNFDQIRINHKGRVEKLN